MRIISGTHKGRKIIAPANLPVRPTTDRAKESLFNILNNYIDFENVSMLDLFSGTGNISYEMISRGCPSVTSVDLNRHCVNFINNSKINLDFKGLEVIQSDFRTFISNTKSKWELIFADPPYDLGSVAEIPQLIFEFNLLLPGGYLVIEHDRQIDYSKNSFFREHRKYGKVNFSFFVNPMQV